MAISAISHVSISVSNLDHSAEWYAQVLGWTEHFRDRSETTQFAYGLLDGDVAIVLRQHDDPLESTFDERRTGLDHLSLAVAADDLEKFADRLRTTRSTFSPICDIGYAQLLSFRDPDNVALELFALVDPA